MMWGAGYRVLGATFKVQGAWCKVQSARCMLHVACCGVYGAWCRVHGSGCMVHGAWCILHVAECMVHGARCMVRGARYMVQGAGCMVQGAGYTVQGAGWMVQGAGCRVPDGWCRVQGAGCRVRCVTAARNGTDLGSCHMAFTCPRSKTISLLHLSLLNPVYGPSLLNLTDAPARRGSEFRVEGVGLRVQGAVAGPYTLHPQPSTPKAIRLSFLPSTNPFHFFARHPPSLPHPLHFLPSAAASVRVHASRVGSNKGISPLHEPPPTQEQPRLGSVVSEPTPHRTTLELIQLIPAEMPFPGAAGMLKIIWE